MLNNARHALLDAFAKMMLHCFGGSERNHAGAPMGRHAYWSPKDKAEQEFVRDYIRECILPYAEQLEMSHTYPVRAGELAHLRTDFTFTLAQPSDAGRLLSDLHPTPAVCGLPTSEAREIIAQAEPHSRRYYAGFAGPWHLEAATHLYVSTAP